MKLLLQKAGQFLQMAVQWMGTAVGVLGPAQQQTLHRPLADKGGKSAAVSVSTGLRRMVSGRPLPVRRWATATPLRRKPMSSASTHKFSIGTLPKST